MGSEGFGRARVTVNEVEAATTCESNSRVSILVNTSIDRCSTFLRQKDVANTVGKLERASWDKITESEPCKHENQGPSLPFEDSSEQVNFRGTSCPSYMQGQRKAGKMSRRSSSSSRCSKRPRLGQLEENTSSVGVGDIKGISDNLGPCHTTKFNSLEKMQMVQQKNNYFSKRSDKRNFKVPAKAKYDSFSIKAGLASSGSAAGGNNFLGVYGLKSEILDITKHADYLSLKDLLHDTYKCPTLGKDKGKMTANLNENFLHSVRKACSSLPLAKPAQSQYFSEMGIGTIKKLLTCPPNSISLESVDDVGDKGNSCSTDQSSCEKESCSKPGTPVNHLDFQLYQPKDILERLELPPPKDLEALLLDAAKPSASSRSNSDIRSDKQISLRASLPPFPWSHSFSGHCRTNSDAVKLFTSRSACQGRWARIATRTNYLRTPTDCFTNLESLTYNQNLVPVSSSISHPWGNWRGSSIATCSKASVVNLVAESGVNLEDQVNAGHCPGVLVAAQTLCNIATQSWRIKPNGITKWPKKPSQKAVKARKSRLFEKAGEVFTTRISQLASDNLVRSGTEQITCSKRPKLSLIEDKKDLNHINDTRKGPTNWSTPRLSRSSPNKTFRIPIAEKIHSDTNILLQSCMMPPPVKVLDKACNSQQKLRKIMTTEWDRGRARVD